MINQREKINIHSVTLLLLYIYYIIFPLEYLMSTNFGTINKILSILISFIIIIAIIINRKINIFNINILFFIFAFLGFISFLWSIDKEKWRFFYQIYLSHIIFILIISNIILDYNESKYLDFSIIIGNLIAIILIITNKNSIADIYFYRISLETQEGHLDPNYLAANISIAMIIVLKYIEKQRHNLIYQILFMAMFFVFLMTGSRGAFIAFIIDCIYFVILKKFKIKRLIKYIIIIIIIYMIAINILPEKLLNRYSIDSLIGKTDSGAGRLDIWKAAIIAIENKPIIGYGVGSETIAIEKYYNIPKAGHNIFIQLLIEFGIIGTVIFFESIYNIKKLINKTGNIYLMILLLNVFILSLFLDPLTTKYFWITIEYIMIYIASYFKTGNSMREL